MRHRVVVLGSLHYDITVDAPVWPQLGETAVGTAWAPKLGGKGRNQAVGAARAGAATAMIGAIGDDQFGHALSADLIRRGIDTRHIRTVPAAGSGMSVALFDASGDYRAVIVSGANLALGVPDVPPPAFWSDVAVLVLQNEVPEAANRLAATAARAAGVTIVLNAAPARPLDPALAVDLLVVNAVEAASLAGISEPRDLASAQQAARLLAAQVPAVVVTAGGAGLAYADATQSLAIPAEPVTLVSSHGAGDEFVGHLAAALARQLPIRDALLLASRAAAKLVSTPTAERD